MRSFISVVVPMTITKEKVSYLNGRSDWTHSVNRLRHRPNLYFTCCIGRLYTVIFGMKVGRLVAGQYAGRRFYKEAHVAKSRNANPLCASVFYHVTFSENGRWTRCFVVIIIIISKPKQTLGLSRKGMVMYRRTGFSTASAEIIFWINNHNLDFHIFLWKLEANIFSLTMYAKKWSIENTNNADSNQFWCIKKT